MLQGATTRQAEDDFNWDNEDDDGDEAKSVVAAANKSRTDSSTPTGQIEERANSSSIQVINSPRESEESYDLVSQPSRIHSRTSPGDGEDPGGADAQATVAVETLKSRKADDEDGDSDWE